MTAPKPDPNQNIEQLIESIQAKFGYGRVANKKIAALISKQICEARIRDFETMLHCHEMWNKQDCTEWLEETIRELKQTPPTPNAHDFDLGICKNCGSKTVFKPCSTPNAGSKGAAPKLVARMIHTCGECPKEFKTRFEVEDHIEKQHLSSKDTK